MSLWIIGGLLISHVAAFGLGWFFRKDNPKTATTVDAITNKA